MKLNLSKMDFVLMYVKGIMGSGKTLFTTNYAIQYSKDYPNNKIYSNYKLKLPNNIYNPFMFFNYSKIDNALIIVDDIKGIANFDKFVFIITNWSRKAKLHILLTGQYYTHFKKESRSLAQFEVQCKYIKERDVLLLAFIDLDGNIYYQKVKNAVKRAKKVYDTKEKIPLATENKLIELIKENSENKDDLEINISLYFKGNKQTSLFKKLCKELGFITP